jgi:hypothetical protein
MAEALLDGHGRLLKPIDRFSESLFSLMMAATPPFLRRVALGRDAGYTLPAQTGLAMALLGAVPIAAVNALGG